jgi:C4-dicarboxylate transporter, DctQ subunit
MAQTPSLHHRAHALSTLRWVDLVSLACGRLCDVMLIAIAMMLTYEVIARYIFLAPTQWTQDVAVTLQIWLTYLGMALVLRNRQMIRISAFLSLAPVRARYVLEGLALVVVAAFAVVASLRGFDMLLDSIRIERRQPTMLALPNWIVELPLVIGFALLALQSLAQLIRLPFGPAPSFSAGGEHDSISDGDSAQTEPACSQPDPVRLRGRA